MEKLSELPNIGKKSRRDSLMLKTAILQKKSFNRQPSRSTEIVIETMKPRLGALSTRAYENMTGIAMANPNGENAGNSCAFSPICWDENGNCVDNVLLMADDITEGLYYAEFDMDAIRSYRDNQNVRNYNK